MRALLLASLIAISAAAQGPPTPGPAADAVLAAFQANDEPALKALAGKEKPDPWLVADQLCVRGEFDAAEAFAKAAPRKDTEKLPAYVAACRGRTFDGEARNAVGLAIEKGRAGAFQDGLQALDAVKPGEDELVRIHADHVRGMLLKALHRHEESVESFQRAADGAERLGWLALAATSLNGCGHASFLRSDFRAAVAFLEREALLHEARGQRSHLAMVRGNMGVVCIHIGDFAGAVEHCRRALAVHEELGNRAEVAKQFGNLGVAYDGLGDFDNGLDCHMRALRLSEELGNRALAAKALGNIGSVYDSYGEHANALRYHQRALEMKERLGDKRDYASTLGNIANTYKSLGKYDKALEYHDQALALKEQLGDRAGISVSLLNIGVIHYMRKDFRKALACQERALGIAREVGDRDTVAILLGNIGSTYAELGEHGKALEFLERSLQLKEELGTVQGVAYGLSSLGELHSRAGDHDKGLAILDRAVAQAEDLGLYGLVVSALRATAEIKRRQGDQRGAIVAGRRAVETMSRVVGGLGEELGASAREQYLVIFETGALASEVLKDSDECTFFLESGRAGALLEALGGKEQLSKGTVSAELLEVERAAQAAVAKARTNYLRARKARDLKQATACKREMNKARDRLEEVVDRIQREAKAAADLVYPEALALRDIQSRLGEREALVLYGLFSVNALALVATREETRIVTLEQPEPIEKACERLVLDDREEDPADALAELRRLVYEPLGLGDETTRVLVSPAGGLSYVPFTLLDPEREVVYVPSGSTYARLLDERGRRGETILALGDPIYTGQLEPLPHTRVEAKALGDRVLLGEDATAANLREILSTRPRWRAVHLACHGSIDPERPMLSSLALTNGSLTAADVCRMRIPADLVALSACETAKGKVYRAEGIVGLTRSFMLAGAPRVLVSLWEVEDEATRVLMGKFYELWSPGGVEGLPAATALKRAQEHVAAQAKWKHPCYWAAWQLWGLPD